MCVATRTSEAYVLLKSVKIKVKAKCREASAALMLSRNMDTQSSLSVEPSAAVHTGKLPRTIFKSIFASQAMES